MSVYRVFLALKMNRTTCLALHISFEATRTPPVILPPTIPSLKRPIAQLMTYPPINPRYHVRSPFHSHNPVPCLFQNHSQHSCSCPFCPLNCSGYTPLELRCPAGASSTNFGRSPLYETVPLRRRCRYRVLKAVTCASAHMTPRGRNGALFEEAHATSLSTASPSIVGNK